MRLIVQPYDEDEDDDYFFVLENKLYFVKESGGTRYDILTF
jgi:hypothetical protein